MALGLEIRDTSGMMKRQFTDLDFPLDSNSADRIPANKSIRFLSLNQVLDRLSVGRSTLYVQLKHPSHPFPAPVHIGRRSVWVESEVEAFMASLVKSERNL